MGGKGPEHPSNSCGKVADCEAGGAESGALGGDSVEKHAPADPDLAALITAWPTLPAALKSGIVAMVKAADAR